MTLQTAYLNPNDFTTLDGFLPTAYGEIPSGTDLGLAYGGFGYPRSAFLGTTSSTQLAPYGDGFFFQDEGATRSDDVGEAIGRIVDQTGNGYNANQTTAAAKPTLGNIAVGGVINQFLNSDTLATQNVTTRAVQYTLSFKGTGTITLSGTSTAGPLIGTGVNDRVSLTFTPTAGTLTCTVSGSCTEAQIQFGASFTAYQRKTTAYDATTAGVPARQMSYFDGGDFLSLGVQAVGTADLFFEAGVPQWLAGASSTFASGAIFIAKAGGTTGNRTLQIATAATGEMVTVLRGGVAFHGAGGSLVDGLLHVWLVEWTGSACNVYIDGNQYLNITVGTAAEEAENILIGARTESAPAGQITGFNDIIGIRAGTLSTAQRTQLLRWMNQYYRGVSI